MSTLAEARASDMEPVPAPVETSVDTESPMTIEEDREGPFRAAWQKLIEKHLLNWLHDPTQLEDEGVEVPQRTIIRLSIDVAEKFRDEGLPPPDSVVPDPNGGIVFERRDNDLTEVIHIWDDGSVEYQQFRGCQLVQRQQILKELVREVLGPFPTPEE